jgi:hypothetical protein
MWLKVCAVSLVFSILTVTEGRANGSGPPPSSTCAPVRTNTFMSLFDPVPVPGLGTEFGKFEAWPLTPEQARIGFVARRASDGAFLIIPNRVSARRQSWVRLTRGRGSNRQVCASRLVATFESDAEASDLQPLVAAIQMAEPSARFVRPIMQNVQVEFTVPFIGLLHRFDSRPTFPLGGVTLVWDIDRRNTRILEDFIRGAGPSVDLPGVIMMREMYTGLLFSISLTISGDNILQNQVNVSVD